MHKSENLKTREYLGDLDVDVKIIFKETGCDVSGYELNSSGLVVGICHHCIKSSGYIRGEINVFEIVGFSVICNYREVVVFKHLSQNQTSVTHILREISKII